MTRRALLLILAVAAFAGITAERAPAAGFGPTTPAYVPGEVIVKFKADTTRAMRSAALREHGGTRLATLNASGRLVRVKVRPGQSVEEAVAAYSADPRVEYAQPNYRYRARALPNDPLVPQQWAIRNLGQPITGSPPAPIARYETVKLYGPNNPPAGGGADLALTRAWDEITDCRSVVVAVVDSGVNVRHEDLAPNMWTSNDPAIPHPGWDFVDNDPDPTDQNGHGSHVAAIVGAAGNNGLGGAGVCWHARVMAVRVLDALAHGTTAAIVAGIGFAVTHGAKVINLSLGGQAGEPADLAFRQAIVDAGTAGALVVAAAGNDGADNDAPPGELPCSFRLPNLICVAALDQAYALASFSNFGATTVHVGAPGTNIASAWAGRHSTIVETFTSTINWFGSSTTGRGWCMRFDLAALANPCAFGADLYGGGTDDRAFKVVTHSAPGAEPPLAMTLDVALIGRIAENGFDALSIAFRPGSTDPFAGGTVVFTGSGSTGGTVIRLPTLDVSGCRTDANGQCALGVRLASAPGSRDVGVAITRFDTTILSADPLVYALVNGTSQAAPHVSGIAAMLFAFNPRYTVGDALEAILSGGRPVPGLAGKTVTGRAADAMGALSFIQAPTGVRATVR
ncbi:MAG TPA: S8 family serine peptidase [Thermodesulfobacteriota bacterium]|nr:S8 family serine peptidase [Thermodesulfobacteriota bacterium]